MRQAALAVGEKLLRKKEVASLLACSARGIDRLASSGRWSMMRNGASFSKRRKKGIPFRAKRGTWRAKQPKRSRRRMARFDPQLHARSESRVDVARRKSERLVKPNPYG